jgi:hypothetical protein
MDARGHSSPQLPDALRKIRRIGGWHHQDGLANPYHPRPPNEAAGWRSSRRPFPDGRASKHDLTNPDGNGTLGSRDVVGHQDPLSLISLDSHAYLYVHGHIMMFPGEGSESTRRIEASGASPGGSTVVNMLTGQA